MDAWPRCLERLEAELPAEDVHTWLKPLQAEQRLDAMVLYAPNAFIVEQVRERYLSRIQELLGHASLSTTQIGRACVRTLRSRYIQAISGRRPA